MPQKESKAVPEGSGPIPQQGKFGSGQPTLTNVYRMMEKLFDRSDRYLDSIKRHFDQHEKMLDEFMEMVDQRVASLEQDAQQPRLTTEADGPADTKTRECTEGAAKNTVQARCMEIAFLRTGLVPTRCVLLIVASVMTELDLRHSLVQGRMPW